MARKKATEYEMPSECCGACQRAANVEQELMCYGMLPAIFKNDIGAIETHRGAVVGRNDPPCIAFSKRLHS